MRALTRVVIAVLAFQLHAALGEAGQGEAAPGKAASIRVLFGSCLDPSRPHPILGRVVKEEPDLFIFMGDNIYADTKRMDVMARKYGELAASTGFRALLAACPVLAVWDDHDYGMNDAGAEYAARRDSRRLFLDFWNVPEDSPRRAHEGVYDARVFGPPGRSVQVILLDTRYFRSPLRRGKRVPTPALGPYLPSDDPSATILGSEQWAWLAEQLRIPARLRLIVSSIQVLAEFHGWESWANFPLEKKKLLDMVRESRSGGVVFLSGDRHMAEISRAGALFDITSSGLNIPFPSDKPSANRYRVGGYYLKENFGMVQVDWESADPEVRLRIYDGRGVVRLETVSSLGDLVF